MEDVQQLIKEKNMLSHTTEGILIIPTMPLNGLSFTKELLYRVIDQKTILLLSGGTTPKELYRTLAREEKLVAGTVGQIDERYGDPDHLDSNQHMINESGLMNYFIVRGIPYYPMLTGDIRVNVAKKYDRTMRDLMSIFSNRVGICGIGSDGHTAGIAGNRHDFVNPMFEPTRAHDYVSEFKDTRGIFGERVSLTFMGLAQLDLIIVIVYGDDKKNALEMMLTPGSEEEIPARFYKRPEIAKKTIIITDQQI